MSVLNKINVAVVGATGFTGLDLVLMLSKHPRVKIVNLCATQNLGKKIIKFETNAQLNNFSIIYFNKVKNYLSINEY